MLIRYGSAVLKLLINLYKFSVTVKTQDSKHKTIVVSIKYGRTLCKLD